MGYFVNLSVVLHTTALSVQSSQQPGHKKTLVVIRTYIDAERWWWYVARIGGQWFTCTGFSIAIPWATKDPGIGPWSCRDGLAWRILNWPSKGKKLKVGGVVVRYPRGSGGIHVYGGFVCQNCGQPNRAVSDPGKKSKCQIYFHAWMQVVRREGWIKLVCRYR